MRERRNRRRQKHHPSPSRGRKTHRACARVISVETSRCRRITLFPPTAWQLCIVPSSQRQRIRSPCCFAHFGGLLLEEGQSRENSHLCQGEKMPIGNEQR